MMARSEDRALQVVMKVLVVVGTMLLMLVILLPGQAFALQAPQAPTPAGQAPPGQSEFIPVDQLPPSEQLPAAPLLIAAYAFAWLAVFFYVWTVWRRLNKVEADMRVFEKRHMRGNPR
jgi:CcmD family protein